MLTSLKSFLERRFYFLWACLMAVVVLVGFGPKFGPRVLNSPNPISPALHFHIAVFTAWIVLLIVQSGLVQAGKVALHRKLGLASAIFGIAIPIVGVWVAFDSAHHRMVPGKSNAESFLLVPLSDMVFFSVLFGLAILWRKKPELHRRLMVMVSGTLVVAALARFPTWIVPPGCFDAAVDVMLLIAVARDLIVDGRIHRVYLIGLPLLAASQTLVTFVRQTEWWIQIARGLLQ